MDESTSNGDHAGVSLVNSSTERSVFDSVLLSHRLCSDAELMRNIWIRYDAEETGSKVFSTLVSALKRLVTEKPPLLGVGSQMYGVGVPAHLGPDGGHGSDVGGVAGMAGMVANAASATVSNVVGMIGSEAGLSVQGSAMKVQW